MVISEEAARERPGRGRLPIRDVGVAEGYELWARRYDSDSQPLLLETRAVDRLLTPLSWTSALDAASGTGRHLGGLAAGSARVVALDQSPEMLRRSVERCRREALPARHFRGDLAALPFDAGAFDLVVCAMALSHVPELSTTIAELARVLRPGGHLLVTDFHPDAVAWGMRSTFAVDGEHYRLPNPGHTRADYLEALSMWGLTLHTVIDISCAEVGVPPSPDLPRRFHEEFNRLGFLFASLAQKEA